MDFTSWDNEALVSQIRHKVGEEAADIIKRKYSSIHNSISKIKNCTRLK